MDYLYKIGNLLKIRPKSIKNYRLICNPQVDINTCFRKRHIGSSIQSTPRSDFELRFGDIVSTHCQGYCYRTFIVRTRSFVHHQSRYIVTQSPHHSTTAGLAFIRTQHNFVAHFVFSTRDTSKRVTNELPNLSSPVSLHTQSHIHTHTHTRKHTLRLLCFKRNSLNRSLNLTVRMSSKEESRFALWFNERQMKCISASNSSQL